MSALDDVQRRDEGIGAAMIAHALMRDGAAIELLAREHEDPAALAVAVARAAYGVLAMTLLRPNQSNLFELQEAYGYAQWLAKDAIDD
jgi:NADP-dependent 3-hydroxy acid dehydrogenase YdfG